MTQSGSYNAMPLPSWPRCRVTPLPEEVEIDAKKRDTISKTVVLTSIYNFVATV